MTWVDALVTGEEEILIAWLDIGRRWAMASSLCPPSPLVALVATEFLTCYSY